MPTLSTTNVNLTRPFVAMIPQRLQEATMSAWKTFWHDEIALAERTKRWGRPVGDRTSFLATGPLDGDEPCQDCEKASKETDGATRDIAIQSDKATR